MVKLKIMKVWSCNVQVSHLKTEGNILTIRIAFCDSKNHPLWFQDHTILEGGCVNVRLADASFFVYEG